MKCIIILIIIAIFTITLGCNTERHIAMKNTENNEIALRWISSYNLHDIEAVVNIYEDDAINLQHPWGKQIIGKENIRNVYKRIFLSFPNIKIEPENIIANDDYLVIQWKFSGTMIGEFAGQKPTGKSFDMHGCEIFKIRNKKVINQIGYWDKETMFKQLGLDLN